MYMTRVLIDLLTHVYIYTIILSIILTHNIIYIIRRRRLRLYKTYVIISIRHFCFIPADHFELDAQISAPDTSGQVEGNGDRLGRGKVPVFRVPRNRVHGRHGLSKSTGKYKTACVPNHIYINFTRVMVVAFDLVWYIDKMEILLYTAAAVSQKCTRNF